MMFWEETMTQYLFFKNKKKGGGGVSRTEYLTFHTHQSRNLKQIFS